MKEMKKCEKKLRKKKGKDTHKNLSNKSPK